MKGLFDCAGLKIVTRWVIDYETSVDRKLLFAGHLFISLVPHDTSSFQRI